MSQNQQNFGQYREPPPDRSTDDSTETTRDPFNILDDSDVPPPIRTEPDPTASGPTPTDADTAGASGYFGPGQTGTKPRRPPPTVFNNTKTYDPMNKPSNVASLNPAETTPQRTSTRFDLDKKIQDLTMSEIMNVLMAIHNEDKELIETVQQDADRRQREASRRSNDMPQGRSSDRDNKPSFQSYRDDPTTGTTGRPHGPQPSGRRGSPSTDTDDDDPRPSHPNVDPSYGYHTGSGHTHRGHGYSRGTGFSRSDRRSNFGPEKLNKTFDTVNPDQPSRRGDDETCPISSDLWDEYAAITATYDRFNPRSLTFPQLYRDHPQQYHAVKSHVLEATLPVFDPSTKDLDFRDFWESLRLYGEENCLSERNYKSMLATLCKGSAKTFVQTLTHQDRLPLRGMLQRLATRYIPFIPDRQNTSQVLTREAGEHLDNFMAKACSHIMRAAKREKHAAVESFVPFHMEQALRKAIDTETLKYLDVLVHESEYVKHERITLIDMVNKLMLFEHRFGLVPIKDIKVTVLHDVEAAPAHHFRPRSTPQNSLMPINSATASRSSDHKSRSRSRESLHKSKSVDFKTRPRSESFSKPGTFEKVSQQVLEEQKKARPERMDTSDYSQGNRSSSLSFDRQGLSQSNDRSNSESRGVKRPRSSFEGGNDRQETSYANRTSNAGQRGRSYDNRNLSSDRQAQPYNRNRSYSRDRPNYREMSADRRTFAERQSRPPRRFAEPANWTFTQDGPPRRSASQGYTYVPQDVNYVDDPERTDWLKTLKNQRKSSVNRFIPGRSASGTRFIQSEKDYINMWNKRVPVAQIPPRTAIHLTNEYWITCDSHGKDCNVLHSVSSPTSRINYNRIGNDRPNRSAFRSYVTRLTSTSKYRLMPLSPKVFKSKSEVQREVSKSGKSHSPQSAYLVECTQPYISLAIQSPEGAAARFPTRALVDTGSSATLISESLYVNMHQAGIRLPWFQIPPKLAMQDAGNHYQSLAGMTRFFVILRDKRLPHQETKLLIDAVIVKRLIPDVHVILGSDVLCDPQKTAMITPDRVIFIKPHHVDCCMVELEYVPAGHAPILAMTRTTVRSEDSMETDTHTTKQCSVDYDALMEELRSDLTKVKLDSFRKEIPSATKSRLSENDPIQPATPRPRIRKRRIPKHKHSTRPFREVTLLKSKLAEVTEMLHELQVKQNGDIVGKLVNTDQTLQEGDPKGLIGKKNLTKGALVLTNHGPYHRCHRVHCYKLHKIEDSDHYVTPNELQQSKLLKSIPTALELQDAIYYFKRRHSLVPLK